MQITMLQPGRYRPPPANHCKTHMKCHLVGPMLRIPCKKYYAEHLGPAWAKCCSRLRAAHSFIIKASEALRFCSNKSENVDSGMFANALCFQGFGFWRPEMFFSKQVSLNNSRSASRIPCKKKNTTRSISASTARNVDLAHARMLGRLVEIHDQVKASE